MARQPYPRTFGNYVLLERLGAGGMSEVDLARRTVHDASYVRFLVIKRMRPGNDGDGHFVRMFQDEARITAALSHENIAQVYDFGREGDELYLAMEYVPGMDLRAVQLALAARGRLLPVRIGLTVLCGVLRALQYAHTRVDPFGRPMAIVHRDVNPRNIMLSVMGEVKLIDFGVAKAADRLEETEASAVKGKFAYMAPEQVEGPGILDGRADLFAVGLVLHELVTGRSPFAGLTEVQIVHRLLSGRIAPLPDTIDHPRPDVLQAIHRRALALRPEDRYRDADAMRADLEQALAPVGGLAPPTLLAELLREANATGVEDISRRLKRYRDDSSASLPSPTPQPVPAPPPPREQSGTLNVSSIREPGPGWLAWAVGGGVGAVAATLGLLGLVAAAAAWWTREEAEPVAPIAAPTPELPPAPVAPPPTAPPETAPETAPDLTTKATAVAPARPAATRPPEATKPVAVAEPVATPPTVEAAPEPPSFEAKAETAPETKPEAKPEAPAETGFLNLTSRPLGLEVYVGGTRVGVTPLRMTKAPAGRYDVVLREPATGRTVTHAVEVPVGLASRPFVVTLP